MLTHEEFMTRGRAIHGNVKVERLDSRLLTGEPYYLFNIYRREFNINLGTCGQYWIPACPEGQEWFRSPSIVPGTVEDIYPHFTDSEEYRCRPTSGEDVVKAVLGLDRPEEDITSLGVFASHNFTPAKQEVAACKSKLIPKLQKQIAQADRMFVSADAGERMSVFDPKYFDAARYLNVKKPWLSEAAEMTMCPFCSIAVSPNAAICSGCNQVIDQTKFDAIKARVAGAK